MPLWRSGVATDCKSDGCQLSIAMRRNVLLQFPHFINKTKRGAEFCHSLHDVSKMSGEYLKACISFPTLLYAGDSIKFNKKQTFYILQGT